MPLGRGEAGAPLSATSHVELSVESSIMAQSGDGGPL
jgi:hypothetical protein